MRLSLRLPHAAHGRVPEGRSYVPTEGWHVRVLLSPVFDVVDSYRLYEHNGAFKVNLKHFLIEPKLNRSYGRFVEGQ